MTRPLCTDQSFDLVHRRENTARYHSRTAWDKASLRLDFETGVASQGVSILLRQLICPLFPLPCISAPVHPSNCNTEGKKLMLVYSLLFWLDWMDAGGTASHSKPTLGHKLHAQTDPSSAQVGWRSGVRTAGGAAPSSSRPKILDFTVRCTCSVGPRVWSQTVDSWEPQVLAAPDRRHPRRTALIGIALPSSPEACAAHPTNQHFSHIWWGSKQNEHFYVRER